MLTVYQATAVLTTVTFTNSAGVVTDPTTITLKYAIEGQAPTTETYASSAVTRVSTGVYEYTLDTSVGAGTWTVEWIATGTCEAVEALTFSVISAPL
jgi:hypothetical protein